jgi:hypothetical protein
MLVALRGCVEMTMLLIVLQRFLSQAQRFLSLAWLARSCSPHSNYTIALSLFNTASRRVVVILKDSQFYRL